MHKSYRGLVGIFVVVFIWVFLLYSQMSSMTVVSSWEKEEKVSIPYDTLFNYLCICRAQNHN